VLIFSVLDNLLQIKLFYKQISMQVVQKVKKLTEIIAA